MAIAFNKLTQYIKGNLNCSDYQKKLSADYTAMLGPPKLKDAN